MESSRPQPSFRFQSATDVNAKSTHCGHRVNLHLRNRQERQNVDRADNCNNVGRVELGSVQGNKYRQFTVDRLRLGIYGGRQTLRWHKAWAKHVLLVTRANGGHVLNGEGTPPG